MNNMFALNMYVGKIKFFVGENGSTYKNDWAKFAATVQSD